MCMLSESEQRSMAINIDMAKVEKRAIDMRVVCVKYGAIRIVIRLIHDQYYVVSCWFQNVLLFVLCFSKRFFLHDFSCLVFVYFTLFVYCTAAAIFLHRLIVTTSFQKSFFHLFSTLEIVGGLHRFSLIQIASRKTHTKKVRPLA